MPFHKCDIFCGTEGVVLLFFRIIHEKSELFLNKELKGCGPNCLLVLRKCWAYKEKRMK